MDKSQTRLRTEATPKTIPLTAIKQVSKYNVRAHDPLQSKGDPALKQDLLEKGYNFAPLIVRPLPNGKDEEYELIDGYQRFKAFKSMTVDELSQVEVKALVMELTENEAQLWVGDANEFRSDFNRFEQATYYLQLLKTGAVKNREALRKRLAERGQKITTSKLTRIMRPGQLPREFVKLVDQQESFPLSAAERVYDYLREHDALDPKPLSGGPMQLEPFKLTDIGHRLLHEAKEVLPPNDKGHTKVKIADLIKALEGNFRFNNHVAADSAKPTDFGVYSVERVVSVTRNLTNPNRLTLEFSDDDYNLRKLFDLLRDELHYKPFALNKRNKGAQAIDPVSWQQRGALFVKTPDNSLEASLRDVFGDEWFFNRHWVPYVTGFLAASIVHREELTKSKQEHYETAEGLLLLSEAAERILNERSESVTFELEKLKDQSVKDRRTQAVQDAQRVLLPYFEQFDGLSELESYLRQLTGT